MSLLEDFRRKFLYDNPIATEKEIRSAYEKSIGESAADDEY